MKQEAQKPLVAVIATGGTIASERGRNGASQPKLDGESLLGGIESEAVNLKAIELMAKDSASLTAADMQEISHCVGSLLNDPAIDGIVVLHGTDAMEETALLVELQHECRKPVIFTGAQFTADHPEADGPGNLEAAIELAADYSQAARGVLIVFGGKVLPSLEPLQAFCR